MKVHRAVTLRHPERDSLSLIEYLADFCGTSTRYRYLRDASFEYQQGINADAVIIHRCDREPFPALSFATSNGATMSLTNIVPQTQLSIDIDSYNGFATEFVADVRAYARCSGRPISVACTSDELTLESVIPGRKTRSYFERFLSLHPRSHHFYDTRRLDVFICAAYRYGKGRVDCRRLRRYLTEVLHWSREDAAWCCDRITTGLEVLEVEHDF